MNIEYDFAKVNYLAFTASLLLLSLLSLLCEGLNKGGNDPQNAMENIKATYKDDLEEVFYDAAYFIHKMIEDCKK